MGVQSNTIREDKLSVFHGSNGLHAGTLTLTEEIDRLGPTSSWTWTWIGGPFGPLGGNQRWDVLRVQTLPGYPTLNFVNKLMIFLDPYDTVERYRGPRALTDGRWNGRPTLPARPYFKRGDAIQLVDWNFTTAGSPGGHVFRCTVIQSA